MIRALSTAAEGSASTLRLSTAMIDSPVCVIYEETVHLLAARVPQLDAAPSPAKGPGHAFVIINGR